MYSVDIYSRVRRACLKDGMSGREAARFFNSTGLKISGEGEWQGAKHETRRKRRSRRKLHPGLDLVSGDIVCSGLTTNDVGDPTALPEMPDQIDGPVELCKTRSNIGPQKRLHIAVVAE